MKPGREDKIRDRELNEYLKDPTDCPECGYSTIDVDGDYEFCECGYRELIERN